jgi:hypothetical protein
MHSSHREAGEVPATPEAAAPAAAPDEPAMQGELNLTTPPPDAGRETR